MVIYLKPCKWKIPLSKVQNIEGREEIDSRLVEPDSVPNKLISPTILKFQVKDKSLLPKDDYNYVITK